MNNLADEFSLFSWLWNIPEQIMISFNVFIILIYSENVPSESFCILGTQHFLYVCCLARIDQINQSHDVDIVVWLGKHLNTVYQINI